jgi:hypothetical protein
MEQPSGCPVLNDTAVSGLMQTAATTDTGLVIMNIPGVQWFLSSGNTTMIHRNAVEEIKLPSPKRKDSYSYEQKGKTYVSSLLYFLYTLNFCTWQHTN